MPPDQIATEIGELARHPVLKNTSDQRNEGAFKLYGLTKMRIKFHFPF